MMGTLLLLFLSRACFGAHGAAIITEREVDVVRRGSSAERAAPASAAPPLAFFLLSEACGGPVFRAPAKNMEVKFIISPLFPSPFFLPSSTIRAAERQHDAANQA